MDSEDLSARIAALEVVLRDERRASLSELAQASELNDRLIRELDRVRVERDAYAARKLVRWCDAIMTRFCH